MGRAAHTSFPFFFNDTATTEIYTLSLHDALPISVGDAPGLRPRAGGPECFPPQGGRPRPETGSSSPGRGDRKSTRLNSSHQITSYAVFSLKKKKTRHP